MLAIVVAGVSGVYGESWTTYNNNNTGGAVGNNTVNSAAVQSGGNKWFGTNGGGLAKYDGTTWTKYGTAQGLAGNTVNHVDFDSSGNVWVATSTGLSKYVGSSWTKYTTGNSGLAGNNCLTVATQSTTIWIGTYANGVSKYDGTTWTTYTTANSGLANNRVLDAVADGAGNKWFATLTGVSKYDGTTWAKYTTGNSGLANNNVKAVALAPNGDIWFGTAGGVNRLSGSSWTTYLIAQGLAENDTSAIDVASDGTVWAGHTGSGVSKFTGSVPWTVYTTANGLANNNVNGIDTESPTIVWFATGGGGVSKYDFTPIPPVAQFSGSPTSGNVPLTVNFTDSSTGTITSWSWTFGDSGTSTAQNPSHQYTSAGTYTVSLTVSGPGGNDTNTKTNYIVVNNILPPVADFSGSPTSGFKPLTVNFTNTSTGSVTAWSWNFGDSGTSTQQNPSHQYQNAGTYTVSLTATGPGGSNIKTRSNYITVTNATPPAANFYGFPTSGSYPLTVNFTDQSTGSITGWSWTFGDSGTSTAQNPSHVYNSIGSYTVGLTVSGPLGSNTSTRVNYIIVTAPVAPTAAFSGSPTSGDIPLTVNFIDQSTGGVTAWSWTFGDGGTSTQQNPGHVYNNAGVYTVSLIVTNSVGSDTETKTNYITVNGPQYEEVWTTYNNSNTGGAIGNNTINAAAVESNGTKWFGTNGGGVAKYDGTTWTKYTTAQGLANNTVFGITFDGSGNKWVATNGGVGKYTGTSWTKYTTGNSGLANNNTRAIAVDNSGDVWVATLNSGVCKFNGASWTKYNTSNSGLAANAVRGVTVDSSNNKWIATSGGVSKYDNTTWTTCGKPPLASLDTKAVAIAPNGDKWVATLSGVNRLIGTSWVTYTTSDGLAKNDTLSIIVDSGSVVWAGSNGSGASMFAGTTPWTVFNTTNSGLANNTVNAVAAESPLKLWFGTGSGVSLREMQIAGPTAAFSASPASGPVPLAVNFTDLSMGSVTSWSWTFGDGGTSTVRNPSHTYNAVGTYTVSLTVSGSGGSDIETKANYIAVYAPAQPYSKRINCGGGAFTDQSGRLWSADQAYTSGGWGYVDGEIGFTSDPISNTEDDQLYQTERCRTFSYKFDVANGNYDVTLCFAEILETRAGMRVFDVKIEGNTVLDNYDIYADVGHDVATQKEFLNIPVTDGQLKVDLVSVKGRAKLSAINVRVSGTPRVDFSASPLAGYAPLAVNFTDQSIGNVTGWGWNFGDGGTSTVQNPAHTYTPQGIYAVTLAVSGPLGSDALMKPSYINAEGPPVGILDPNHIVFDANQGELVEGHTDLINIGYDYLVMEVNSISAAWLSIFPTAGSLPPYFYYHFDVWADSTGLGAGTYYGTVVIHTNDPIHPDFTLYVTLNVHLTPPAADFSATPMLGRPPMNVSFTDQSIKGGTVTGWSWNFGDGGTSTQQNPTHTYPNVGVYTVTLTATGPGGTDTEVKNVEVSNSRAVVSPTSLTFNIGSGGIADQNVGISNIGTSNLTFGLQSIVLHSGGEGLMSPQGGSEQSAEATALSSATANKSGFEAPLSPLPDENEMFKHKYAAGRLLVKMKSGDPATDGAGINSTTSALLGSMGIHQERTLMKKRNNSKNGVPGGSGESEWVLMKTDGAVDLKAVRRELLKDAAVEYVEPDYIVTVADTIPNDYYFGFLWGMHNTGQNSGTPGADISATDAWSISTGSDEVLVGVIDTGINYNHEDLAANIWTNPGEIPGNGKDDDGNGYIDDVHGYDFYNNDSDPMDDHFHGTHVAGTIAGRGDNGIGVAGVCWRAKLVALKFISSAGSGYTSDAVRAVDYANMMGISITNNSWGGGGYSQALKDAIDEGGAKGYLFIASAGNNGHDIDSYPMYPASYSSANIISVAATDNKDMKASFSNYGLTSVDLGAPGVNIFSCAIDGTYFYLNGTSMAAPHVSGAAALLKSYNPVISGTEIKNAILSSVDPIAAMQGITVSGGRLNVYKALQKISQWLSVSPVSGNVTPSGREDVVVTVDANGIKAGTYTATINLKTNDPDNSSPVVDVTMNVTGAKRLSVSPGTCNFGEVRVGTAVSMGVTLRNSGSNATTVSSIGINNTAFTHGAALPLTVPAFSSRSFQVTFSPTQVGYASGTMTISSNADDNPVLTVYLNGEGKMIVAAFSGAPKSGSPPLAVSFTDLSSGNITGWSWTFGDGGTSTTQNPSHTYQSVGDYTVSLEVSGPDGNDTEVKSDYISVR